MKTYILYDIIGEIIAATIVSDETAPPITIPPNLTSLVLDKPILFNQGYISNNEYVAYTDEQRALKDNRPYYPAKWSNTTMSWEDLRSQQEKLDQQWIGIKGQRDKLLQQSDWRVVKATDIGVPISQTWKDYRQALRDITTQSDPFNIVWPITPTT
jgi:hypothetical protein